MTSEIGSASYDLSNCVNSLECPVTYKPLFDAVVLIPCGHTISEIAAKNIYRGMTYGEVEQQAPCPLCRRTAKAYYPNLTVRDFVGSLRKMHIKEALPIVSKKVMADAEIDLHTIPFPGKSANFVLSDGDWISRDKTGMNLKRYLEFSSKTSGSFFKKVTFLGYEDNKIRISVDFNKYNKNLISDYFLKCGIEIDRIEKDRGTYFSNKLTTKLLFKIIMMHNELPEEYIPVIREAILFSS